MIDKHTITGYKTVTAGMASWYDPKYKFAVGKTYTIKNAREDGRPCGEGLHFCLKQKETEQYTKDRQNYIVLQVESDVADILGMDSSKIRTKTLKVVKILEKHTKYGAAFHTTVKELKAMRLGMKFLKPKKTTNEAVIKAASAEPMKILKAKKLHVFSNLFELNYYLEDEDTTITMNGSRIFSGNEQHVLNKHVTGDPYKLCGFKALSVGLSFCIHVQKVADNIVHGYLESSSVTPVSEKKKLCKSLVDLLALGALPIGVRSGTFLVYLPAETKPSLSHL